MRRILGYHADPPPAALADGVASSDETAERSGSLPAKESPRA